MERALADALGVPGGYTVLNKVNCRDCAGHKPLAGSPRRIRPEFPADWARSTGAPGSIDTRRWKPAFRQDWKRMKTRDDRDESGKMARWRNEQTRRIMEYTRDMHGEFQSVRRVMEALNGALDDVEWFSIQTASLDPGGHPGDARHERLPEPPGPVALLAHDDDRRPPHGLRDALRPARPARTPGGILRPRRQGAGPEDHERVPPTDGPGHQLHPGPACWTRRTSERAPRSARSAGCWLTPQTPG